MNEYCLCVMCLSGAWKPICERRPNWQHKMDNPETMKSSESFGNEREKKNIRKKGNICCHLRYGYFVTVNRS